MVEVVEISLINVSFDVAANSQIFVNCSKVLDVAKSTQEFAKKSCM